MAYTPRTDPFWIGDPCAPLSAYTPSVFKDIVPCCPLPIPTVNVEGIEFNLSSLEMTIEDSLMNQTNTMLSALCDKNDAVLSALQCLIETEELDDFTPIG